MFKNPSAANAELKEFSPVADFREPLINYGKGQETGAEEGLNKWSDSKPAIVYFTARKRHCFIDETIEEDLNIEYK